MGPVTDVLVYLVIALVAVPPWAAYRRLIRAPRKGNAMRALDQTHQLQVHAHAWRIPACSRDFGYIAPGKVVTTVALHFGQVALFQRWSTTMLNPIIRAGVHGGVGTVSVDGQLMLGLHVHLTVDLDRGVVDALGVHGIVTHGHVEQLVAAAKRVTS